VGNQGATPHNTLLIDHQTNLPLADNSIKPSPNDETANFYAAYTLADKFAKAFSCGLIHPALTWTQPSKPLHHQILQTTT
jgi:hypothetical protein